MDLRAGVVRSCTIGACVQVEGFDVSRLSDLVEYEDNGIRLDSVELPLPDVVEQVVSM